MILRPQISTLLTYTTLIRSNQTPTNQTPTNQTPTNQTPTNQTPTNQTPTNQTPTNQTPTNQTTINNLSTIATKSDRKSTRLNSSHANISYAVFCLKNKTNNK